MKLGIIVGSHRKNSQSKNVGAWLHSISQKEGFFSDFYVLNLGETVLPLWDEEIWSEDQGKWSKLWEPISKELKSCDAFVVISPEWAGMAPSGLKNIFLLCSQGELAFKPAYLVGVSASRGGAYPIAELRMSSYKNNFINYLPEHLIVRDVEGTLKAMEGSYIEKRAKYGLTLLSSYSKAHQKVRSEGVINLEKYGFGMS